MESKKRFIKALAIFLGTIIGAGIFGLPFVALKAGFFVVCCYFLFMTAVVVLIHYLYGEIALGTEKTYRLPGYVGEYLGPLWKKITFLIIALGIMGALLAYLIIGGEFLNSLFAPYFGGCPTLYALLFFVLGSYLIFKGIKSIVSVELFLLVVFLIILGIFFVKAFPIINFSYFTNFDIRFLTFPYGVILFSLWGASLIPEMKEILSFSDSSMGRTNLEAGKDLKRVIICGIVFSAVIYLLFIFVILGASGFATSKEALSGFSLATGNGIVALGFIFGVICCFTSFITLGLTLKKIFWYDFGFSKNFSWFITCFLPLVFFLAGMREFIDIIGFTGALALGFEGIIIVFLYKEFLKKKFSKKMNPLFYLLTGIFILGVVFEIIYFVFAV